MSRIAKGVRLTPADGPPGDGDDRQTGCLQVGECLQRVGRDALPGGQGVVDVGEDATNGSKFIQREKME